MADLTSGICLVPPTNYKISNVSWSGTPGMKLQSTIVGRKPWLLNYTGAFKIAGSTVAGAQPFKATVLLFPQKNPSLCVASANTDETGTFTFNYLASGSYIVVAIDMTGTYNTVTYDFVAAVSM